MSWDLSALRIWHTVRHLGADQILSQVRFRLQPLRTDPDRFRLRDTPAFPGCLWRPRGAFLPPGPSQNSASDVLDGRFTFLRRTETLGWPPAWDAVGLPKLWRINLHYFDWLWQLDPTSARQGVLDWIARYELRHGAQGWEPYPVSLRLLNWIARFFGEPEALFGTDPEFVDRLWRSIFLQTEWLTLHLEEHLRGNHLLENASALAFAGSCFAGPDAERWYRIGRELLARELREQVLDDGMHFERSPMYHQRMTYLLVLLGSTGRDDLDGIVAKHLASMLEALSHLRHPDGGIALLNDSALGTYNDPQELIEAGLRVLGGAGSARLARPGAWALPDAGYFGFRGPQGDYVVCDAGPIGPDYIPGHAHGDLLSFEASFGGQRVFVDAGVHDYEKGELRRYCRSTRAHNTVEIEHRDQCEFWGAFRVARRGRPHDVVWEARPDGFRLSAWHDGYRRLKGEPSHRRETRWLQGAGLDVVDEVSASRPVESVSRLHLHPSCRLVRQQGDEVELQHPAGRLRVRFQGPGRLTVEPSRYCPEFGRLEENLALAYTCRDKHVRTALRIERL